MKLNKWFLLIVYAVLFSTIANAADVYHFLEMDRQRPLTDHIIDKVFSGNQPLEEVRLYDSESPLTLTGWTLYFKYGYGKYDTNGMVSITGTQPGSSNVWHFTGGTNVYFEEYDNYYFS